MLPPDQIRLARQSYQDIEPFSEKVSHLFYRRLFEIAPPLKPLFRQTNMPEQGQMLMHTIGFVVKELDQPEILKTPLVELGQRHAAYRRAEPSLPKPSRSERLKAERGSSDC